MTVALSWWIWVSTRCATLPVRSACSRSRVPVSSERSRALRSLDAFAGNLPVQFTSFVGRDDEMARVVTMLDDASLVTLIGTGGVGKTRLAIQAAAEAVPHFADGAWFCELAASITTTRWRRWLRRRWAACNERVCR